MILITSSSKPRSANLVHVLINGEIVEEGGPELIDDINRRGFTHILDAKAEK